MGYQDDDGIYHLGVDARLTVIESNFSLIFSLGKRILWAVGASILIGVLNNNHLNGAAEVVQHLIEGTP